MKGCDFSSPVIKGIASSHSVGVAQVCLRWVLQRGCVMAVGTGANATTAVRKATNFLLCLNFVSDLICQGTDRPGQPARKGFG
jgi:diketogulonate reductase-like aldo/keto reductase